MRVLERLASRSAMEDPLVAFSAGGKARGAAGVDGQPQAAEGTRKQAAALRFRGQGGGQAGRRRAPARSAGGSLVQGRAITSPGCTKSRSLTAGLSSTTAGSSRLYFWAICRAGHGGQHRRRGVGERLALLLPWERRFSPPHLESC